MVHTPPPPPPVLHGLVWENRFGRRKAITTFFFTDVNLKSILTHLKLVKRAWLEAEDSQKGFGLVPTNPLLIPVMLISVFFYIY